MHCRWLANSASILLCSQHVAGPIQLLCSDYQSEVPLLELAFCFPGSQNLSYSCNHLSLLLSHRDVQFIASSQEGRIDRSRGFRIEVRRCKEIRCHRQTVAFEERQILCSLALTCRNGCRRQRYQYISTIFQQTLAASSLQNCMQTLQRSSPSSRASRILLTISPCPRPSRKRLLTRRFDGKVIESFLVALILTLTDKGKASNTRFALTRYLRPDAPHDQLTASLEISQVSMSCASLRYRLLSLCHPII